MLEGTMLEGTMEEASARLSELVGEANAGQEVVITEGERPVARLVGVPRQKKQPVRGSARGVILHIADDFDATPEGFEDCM